MNTKHLIFGLLVTLGASPISAAGEKSKPGAPEIIKVMDLDGLTVVGKRGVEKQYKYLREPNAVVTKDGTLIVVAGPHHVRGKNDRAHQDALCRTSKDGGKTWSDITMIADAGMGSVLPTVLVYDRKKDRVLFVYNIIFNDKDRPKEEKKPCQQFVIHSDDAGATWSAPQEILKGLSGICVFGGGNGFQLKHGKDKGRLLIPGGHRTGGFLRGYFFSDDHGETWSFQKMALEGRLEATGCELNDGTIMLVHRQSGYGMAEAVSKDGGETWSEQTAMLPDAWSSCNNSALSIDGPGGEGLVLIAAPLGPENAPKYAVEQDAAKLKRGAEDSKQVARSNGGVFLSSDGGKTWPIGVCVAPGWTFGYNALVALPDNEVGLVFEGSPSGVAWQKAKRDHNTGARLGIYMVKFSLDWLLAQKDAHTPASGATGANAQRPNVLFIACDDMNDWVGFLGGHPDTLTPNMDRLAERGMVFERAYCASPICGPSRAAVLTGLKPETSGVYNNQGTYVDYVPDALVLPKFFRKHGYHVMGCGKINHAMGCVVPDNYDEFGPDAGAIGGTFTWEELNMNPGKKVERKDIAGISDEVESGIVKNMYPGKEIARGSLKATLPLNGIDNRTDRPANGYNTFDWGPVSVGDEQMPDGKMASWAEAKLRAEHDKPFFLAVGFYRPHQPWYAPAKYFKPFEGKQLTLPPTIARDLADCGEAARQYAHYPWSGSFATVQKHKQWQDAIRGYLASIHFVDAQVGRLLDALDASPHAANTIVVLWSDHGWELGEKEHWGKHSPWEGSMRVPLVIAPPKNLKLPAGRSAAFASLLDLYPTLSDMCGLEPPAGLDGKSLKPVLTGERKRVRDHIATTLGRSTFCIRKGDMKLIRYYDGSEEFYDLKSDPNEFRNLISSSEHASEIAALRELAPVDKRFERFVRYGQYKGMVGADGTLEVCDMLHPKSGIGGRPETMDGKPEIAELIEKYLEEHEVTDRYFTIPHPRE